MRKRRNNTAAGLVVLGGAMLIAFGALRPWSTFTITAPIFHTELKHVDLDLNLVPSIDSGADGATKTILLICAALIGLGGLLLIATRMRALGVLWRLSVLVCWLFPTGVVGLLWYDLSQSPSEVLRNANASFLDKIGAVGSAFGLDKIEPQPGIYILTIGCAIVLIGCLIPAVRKTEYGPEDQPPSPPWSYQPQWQGPQG